MWTHHQRYTRQGIAEKWWGWNQESYILICIFVKFRTYSGEVFTSLTHFPQKLVWVWLVGDILATSSLHVAGLMERDARIREYPIRNQASSGPCLFQCDCLKAWFKGWAKIKAWRVGEQREGGGGDDVICHCLLKTNCWRSLKVPCFQNQDLRHCEKQVREWGTPNQNESPCTPILFPSRAAGDAARVWGHFVRSITRYPQGVLPPC